MLFLLLERMLGLSHCSWWSMCVGQKVFMAQLEGETLEGGAQLGSVAGVSRDEVRVGRGLQPEDGKGDSEKYYLGKSTRFKGREGERC